MDNLKKDENVSTSAEHGEVGTVIEGDSFFTGTVDDVVDALLKDAEDIERTCDNSLQHCDKVYKTFQGLPKTYRTLAAHIGDAHRREMKALYKRGVEVADRLDARIKELEAENRMHRLIGDMQLDAPCRRTCNNFYIDRAIWGVVPEIAIVFHRAYDMSSTIGRDKYQCEMIIQDRYFAPTAITIAVDAIERLFRYTLTGGGDQLKKEAGHVK